MENFKTSYPPQPENQDLLFITSHGKAPYHVFLTRAANTAARAFGIEYNNTEWRKCVETLASLRKNQAILLGSQEINEQKCVTNMMNHSDKVASNVYRLNSKQNRITGADFVSKILTF